MSRARRAGPGSLTSREMNDALALERYPLADGVPLPTTVQRGGRRRGASNWRVYPSAFMAIGQSFFIPASDYGERSWELRSYHVHNAVRSTVEKKGWRFAVRVRDEDDEAADGFPPRRGWRVWRIA